MKLLLLSLCLAASAASAQSPYTDTIANLRSPDRHTRLVALSKLKRWTDAEAVQDAIEAVTKLASSLNSLYSKDGKDISELPAADRTAYVNEMRTVATALRGLLATAPAARHAVFSSLAASAIEHFGEHPDDSGALQSLDFLTTYFGQSREETLLMLEHPSALIQVSAMAAALVHARDSADLSPSQAREIIGKAYRTYTRLLQRGDVLAPIVWEHLELFFPHGLEGLIKQDPVLTQVTLANAAAEQAHLINRIIERRSQRLWHKGELELILSTLASQALHICQVTCSAVTIQSFNRVLQFFEADAARYQNELTLLHERLHPVSSEEQQVTDAIDQERAGRVFALSVAWIQINGMQDGHDSSQHVAHIVQYLLGLERDEREAAMTKLVGDLGDETMADILRVVWANRESNQLLLDAGMIPACSTAFSLFKGSSS